MKPTVEQYEAIWKLEKLPARQVIAPCGFGKTLIGVELDFRLARHLGPRLIITTPGALTQWRDTVAEQSDGHTETVFGLTINRGAQTHVYRHETRDDFLAALANARNGIFILPWHMLNRPQKNKEVKRKLWARDVLWPVLSKIKWAHIICDEAHKLNGRKTAMTKALKALKTQHKTAITATPATNVPWQWWSILHWLYPKDWSSYWRFFERYVVYEEVRKGHVVIKEPVTVQRAEEFNSKIEPFTYRGKKVVYGGKRYRTIEVDLDPKQRRAYDTMEKEFVAWLGEQEDEFLPAPNVISQLQRLQQFALGYAKLETHEVYRKAGWKKGTVEREQRVVLSEPSAKLDALMEFLEDNPDERALVYSSFRGPLELLQARCEKAGVSYGLCMGTSSRTSVHVTAEQREQAIRDFAAGRLRVMLASIQAGGESIDGWQHACNTAIYLDRAWSPAANEQSEGRLDRRGQRYTVNVIDIVARDTVDIPRGIKLETKKSWLRKFVER